MPDLTPQAKPLPPSDFCSVQLTVAGAAFAGGARLHIADGRFHFLFEPNAPVRTAKYEWELFLSRQHTPAGDPLFELATSPQEAK